MLQLCRLGNVVKDASGMVCEGVKINDKGEEVKSREAQMEVVFMKKGEVITAADPKTSKLIGCPKGRLVILMERGKNVWKDGGSRPIVGDCKARVGEHSGDCCTKGMLMSCGDFDVKKSRLHEILHDAGHILIMLPKFHCELAAIERVWCRAKWWCRRRCGYSIVSLRNNTTSDDRLRKLALI